MSTLNVNNINEVGGVDAIVTSGVLDSGSLPAGSILQVVKFETTTTTDSTSTSFVDSALVSSITLTSASSKVLIIASVGQFANTDPSAAAKMRLYRGDTSTGTALGLNESFAEAYNNNGTGMTSNEASIIYLDEPSTAGSVTYTVGAKSNSASNRVLMRRQQTMLLFEVAG